MPILKTLTINEFPLKDSFHFHKEIFDKQLDFFMGSIEAESFFTNIPLEKTIEMCANERFTESETIEGLSKPEFK